MCCVAFMTSSPIPSTLLICIIGTTGILLSPLYKPASIISRAYDSVEISFSIKNCSATKCKDKSLENPAELLQVLVGYIKWGLQCGWISQWYLKILPRRCWFIYSRGFASVKMTFKTRQNFPWKVWILIWCENFIMHYIA